MLAQTLVYYTLYQANFNPIISAFMVTKYKPTGATMVCDFLASSKTKYEKQIRMVVNYQGIMALRP